MNLKDKCSELNYNCKFYDLGGLGFGESFEINNESFTKFGFYKVMNETSGWCSRALHKPEIIMKTEFDDVLVYMDSDAYPVSRFDEICDEEFDIGVTVRRNGEKYGNLGRINAGVIFFRNTKKAHEFICRWSEKTKTIKNDQIALNDEISTGRYKVHEFPTDIYNYYYFPEAPDDNVKIYHFKSAPNVRSEFIKYAKLK